MSFIPMHVVIIGGGIGGLCLAQGLKANGISVAVYERDPANTWPEGGRIHINPLGSRALHANLPPVLWEAFVASAGKSPAGMGFLTEQMKELLLIEDDFMSSRAGNAIDVHYPVSRIVLRQLLLTGLESVLHYNKTFERYEHTEDGKVTAYFSDGSSVTGDVLVGADGANSRVRKQYLPHAQRLETGVAGVSGKLFLADQSRAWLPPHLVTRLNLIMPSDPYCLFNAAFNRTHTTPGAHNKAIASIQAAGLNPDLFLDTTQDYLLWAFFAHTDEFPTGMQDLDGPGLLQAIGQIIPSWHPDLRRLVAESAPTSVSFKPFKVSELIDPWQSTNITLLGDAIHNMPPVGGLGGNMALRDAQALARTLTGVQQGQSSLIPAIQVYEAEMRKYGFAAVRAASRYMHLTTTSNRLIRGAARAWFQTCNAIPPLKHTFTAKWTEPMRVQPERPADAGLA